MKITTADFKQEDVRAIQQFVAITAKKTGKPITLKQYARFCIVEMTNNLIALHEKEMVELAKNKIEKEKSSEQISKSSGTLPQDSNGEGAGSSNTSSSGQENEQASLDLGGPETQEVQPR